MKLFFLLLALVSRWSQSTVLLLSDRMRLRDRLESAKAQDAELNPTESRHARNIREAAEHQAAVEEDSEDDVPAPVISSGGKPDCSAVDASVKSAAPAWAPKVKCVHVFAGGAAAPWAAKFELKQDWSPYKKGDPVVIKKCNFNGEYGGMSGEEQYNNEAGALMAMKNSKQPNRFPKYVGSTKNKDAGVGFIAMEYVEGTNCCGGMFEHITKEGTEGREIMDSFVRALSVMWDAGWAHSDHNGDNAVIYRGAGKFANKMWLKLMDFGLAIPERKAAEYKNAMRSDCWTAWYWASHGLLPEDEEDSDAWYPYPEDDDKLSTRAARDLAQKSLVQLKAAMDKKKAAA